MLEFRLFSVGRDERRSAAAEPLALGESPAELTQSTRIAPTLEPLRDEALWDEGEIAETTVAADVRDVSESLRRVPHIPMLRVRERLDPHRFSGEDAAELTSGETLLLTSTRRASRAGETVGSASSATSAGSFESRVRSIGPR